ncbi:MAG: AAA family ATPase [Actinomycetota bacterium]
MARRVLLAKIHPPDLLPDVIERPRVAGRLAASAAPVWLIVGPAGYGKTTLARQVTDSVEATVAWVSLDDGDNDPVRFWTHVVAAVCGPGDAVDEVLAAVSPDATATAADEVASFVEVQPGRVVLVLDDVDAVTADAVLEPLGRLVQRPPSNLTLVLIGRDEPGLPVARLRSQARLAEVRADDLAFTAAETGALFGGEATIADLEEVVSTTDGWPTALRMLALAPAGDDGSDELMSRMRQRRDALGEVLAHEVVGGLDESLRAFLVATSIVDPLVPELCNALTGTDRSLAVLRDLVRRQLFTVTVDPEATQFRYHSVFRDFLRARADELPTERLRSLHQRAADWYTEAGEPTAAIDHALAAGDDAQALATIKAHFIDTARDGYLATVNEWLERYGLDRCRDDPELVMAAAWAALNAKRFDEAWRWVADPATAPDPYFQVQRLAQQSHLHRHQGRVVEAIAAAEAATVVADRSTSVDYPGVAWAALAMGQLLDGRLDPEVAHRAVDIGRATGDTATEITGHAALAVEAARHDRLDEAEVGAAAALAKVDSPTLERFHQPSLAHLARSMVALARGRPADAEEAAREAARISAESAEPLIDAWIAAHRARIAHAAGHQDRARALLRSAEAALDGCESEFLRHELRRTGNVIRFARPVGGVTVDDLTDRELAVLRLLPQGLTRRQLGQQLYVSENTIKSYLTMLRNKLGVTGTSAQIVAKARELGLLQDGHPGG